MNHNLYAIFDTACGTYTKPVFAPADGVVTREFQSLCTNDENPYGEHPEDYTLFRLGTLDDQTGKFSPEDPCKIATGLELVALSRAVNREATELLNKQLNEQAN